MYDWTESESENGNQMRLVDGGKIVKLGRQRLITVTREPLSICAITSDDASADAVAALLAVEIEAVAAKAKAAGAL